ncbi:Os1348 family NHLP clan protein [Azospirillum sp. B4]|uniref:Os1348 family NHLP clan protein n=1 Tax=Azospirillum sp. B4 TaxID=95605 RepID=UPI0005C97C75|nr:Os1348 family NHLP clan protein [Azospirillum sp. B4]
MTIFLRELTPDDVQKILGRALLDANFRSKLAADPEAVLAILGFKASAASLAFFKNLAAASFGTAADDLAKQFGTTPLPTSWL